MSGINWHEVDEVFQAARDVTSVAERTAWLDARCAGRPDLHAEVSSLLSAYDESDAFLQPLGLGRRLAPAPDRDDHRRLAPDSRDRPGRHGHRVPRRTRGRRLHAAGGDQDHARVGRRPRRRAPLRRRTADPRLLQSSAHRHAPRRRHDRDGPGVSGDGTRRRRADHRVAARSADAARRRGCDCSGRSARACTRRISTASCTAISSPPTSW